MVKATIENLDVVISGLDNTSIEVREAAFYGVIAALQKAFQACYDVLSEGDHSLKELAEMGHPYSAEHGFQIHDPDVLVHVQSGEYRDALRAEPPAASGGVIIEGKVVNDSPLDRWIQEGTLTMRDRPWMQWIVDHYGSDFADIVQAYISQAVAKAAAR